MKNEVTTVQLKRAVVKALNGIKKYPRETYSDVILDLISFAKAGRAKREYEEFVAKAQEKKMKELWDNKEDEVWGNA